MYCLSRKFRSNWLGATALAGSLGISIFSLTAIQPVMAQSIYLSGGGGGGGSLTGNGGYGAGALISAEKPDIRGHGGQGSGENGGAGGAGGADDASNSDKIAGKNTLTDDQKNALDGFNVGDISSGQQYQGDIGGKGADITANFTKDISIENIILEAGNGGEPGQDQENTTGTFGIGGQGGDVRLEGTGQAVTVNNTVSLTSGRAGGSGDQKSKGGNVRFTTDKIIVGADKEAKINLERNDGQLIFRIEEFDATKGDAIISLANTKAWTNNDDDGVKLGNLKIGMGRKVTITGNGEYSISSLTIGNPVNDPDSENINVGDFIDPAKFSITNDLTLGLNPKDPNSKLIFYLPENVQNGDSLLRMTGNGKVAINNAAVELRLAGTDLRRLSPGDQIRLIEGDVVGNSKNTEASVSNGAKNWNFDIATERENLVASLKGNKATENNGEGTDKADNSGNNQNNTGDDNLANNAGSENDSNNNQDKAKNNGDNNKPDLIGKDDGKGNIYTDNHGAVTINRAKANAYFQSNAAALNALNYGADQIASIDDYVLPMDVKKFGETVEGVAFLQGSGFRQKVETGSHIKNDGYHLMGGAGIRYHEDQGNLLATVFVEHGDGDYDTYHQSIHGKGDFSYTGAGLYAKQTWDNGWFIDGSGRGGRVKRDFKSSDIVNGRFDDKSSNYYGFHIGGGKELEISPDNKLTLNGRLLWTRIEDFSTVTKADEHLGFDSANSVRTHLGARVDHKVTQEAKLYAGAAWEQELDGEIEGKLDSYRVDKPDFSGASAVFEVGGKYEQNQGMQGWVANAGVKGVAGKRDEISGKVGIGYRW
ncbi:autotransporter domain-containing protein [Bartonella sp. W8097]|uniref:autotransporter outer membrane beta-barrel domain-containing protein n=1 Tax=Bartonella apihabitans TaxID=2750929 RepID=UPI0018DB97E1|nr:autotransporter outer membrane beta-barrel domain-containing protein [Bartonella apihabitans]MBI0020220.1 autotransporter domain-containing protein [Bartonella apihabitans]